MSSVNQTALVVWEQLRHFQGLIGDCSGKVKFAGLNAIDHMFKARELINVDPNMACFRAICAEEEAATSLLSSLKSQNYPDSEKIHLWTHSNKAAVIVFISGVIDWFNELITMDGLPFGKPVLHHTNEPGRPAIELILPWPAIGKALHPRPPLHLLVKGSVSIQEMIGESVRVKLKKKYIQEIRGAVELKANLRNQLLYASDSRIPGRINNHEQFVENQAAVVSALLTAVGLIDPWREPEYPLSGVVVSAISEFVRVMSAVKKNSNKPGNSPAGD